jgi:hypothetical protein
MDNIKILKKVEEGGCGVNSGTVWRDREAL